MSQLLAFNLAEQAAEEDVVEITGEYDDSEQVWTGNDAVTLGQIFCTKSRWYHICLFSVVTYKDDWY